MIPEKAVSLGNIQELMWVDSLGIWVANSDICRTQINKESIKLARPTTY